MNILNQHNLPEAIVEAVKNDDYNKGDCDYSVTELLNPPQVSHLARMHDDEIEVDAIDSIWSLFGKSVHAILERAEPSALTEERHFMKIDLPSGKQVTVSGQFDRLHVANNILQDYKVTSAWTKVFGSRLTEWQQQLNLLRLLVPIQIDKLEIICIYRDWTKYDAEKNADYPQQQVETLDMPIWDLDTARKFLIDRIELHERVRNGEQIDCTHEERWAQPTIHKIMKEGRKTSLRNFKNDLTGAQAFKRAYDRDNPKAVTAIVEHAGKSVRCESYCAGAKFCPQFQATKAVTKQ